MNFFDKLIFVKDHLMGTVLLKGINRNHVYEVPCSMPRSTCTNKSPQRLISNKSSYVERHRRLGHQNSSLLRFMLGNFNLDSNSVTHVFHCDSCHCNKNKKLPFFESSIVSRKPFEIIFFDMWGGPSIKSIDNYHNYVICIDHYTRFSWLFPLKK